MNMYLYQSVLTVTVVIRVVYKDYGVVGSECCEAYTDRYGVWHNQRWCSDYCCYDPIGIFAYDDRECCSSSFLRVKSNERMESCTSWWSEHVWAPVLIGIGCIAVISLCCFGCFKLCTNNNNRTGVVVTNPNQQAVVMMSMQGNGQQPYGQALNQQMYPTPGAAYPVYPPPYVENTVPSKVGT